MSTPAPARLRVDLPRSTMRPRIGKVRLGERRETTKNGRTVLYPTKLPYFKVTEDESGITTRETAEAFHEVYGPEPTALRAMLPGHAPEDVFEGAYRLYGSSKLKRRCDGTTCTERTATGGWAEAPCICQNLPERVIKNGKEVCNPDRCALGYTLQVLLPDVDGVGIWEVTTGSQISARRVTDWLYMVYELTGSLAFVEFDLHLVEQKVSPAELGGKSSTVYVLDPRLRGYTPRQVLAGEAAPQRRLLANGSQPDLPALPPSSLDEERDDLVDPDEESIEVADAVEHEEHVDGETGEIVTNAAIVGGHVVIGDMPLKPRVVAMLNSLSPEDKLEVSDACVHAGIKASVGGLMEAFGDDAEDSTVVKARLAQMLLDQAESDSDKTEAAVRYCKWLPNNLDDAIAEIRQGPAQGELS